MTLTAPSKTKIVEYCRSSSIPYISSLIATYMVGFHFDYVGGVMKTTAFVMWGQSPVIYMPFVLLPAVVFLWIIYEGKPAKGWALAFICILGFAWLVHLLLVFVHGDMYTHATWLYLPTLAMFAIKAPTREDAWGAIVVLAWVAALLLVISRLLEILGLVPMFYIPNVGATEWEKENYWLPFSGYFGLNGRWPGPFGFNDKTGFFSALIAIVAIQRWRPSSLLLGAIGLLGVMLTGGRGPYLALITGIAALAVFSQHVSVLRKIPVSVRISTVALAVAVLGSYFAFFTTAGVTGRNTIWRGFLELWLSSPWTGVGQTGIWETGGIVGAAMDAHSLYVQEITEYGLLGLVTQYAAVGLGMGIALSAAIRGWSGPLAVLAAYAVAAVTSVLHDGWITHSTYTLMVIMAVLSAAGQLPEIQNRKPTNVGIARGK